MRCAHSWRKAPVNFALDRSEKPRLPLPISRFGYHGVHHMACRSCGSRSGILGWGHRTVSGGACHHWNCFPTLGWGCVPDRPRIFLADDAPARLGGRHHVRASRLLRLTKPFVQQWARRTGRNQPSFGQRGHCLHGAELPSRSQLDGACISSQRIRPLCTSKWRP